MSSINTWANDQLKVLNQESNKIFDQLKRDNYIYFEQYKAWVQN